ncbi:helix-turn-helix domain-containing protein [Stackebrandtia nassauensis]|uniref:Transcriptional regulator, AraC family n=1 Tax=Stackebrandtia nassauensis (strain DSM 44728 / CIP 108903 / NRRL B-16338 / NBRC 102104 / LLR-40K-21) TaxID=446470 RepID=D3Q7B9_STANL|nr:helix-turn-helix domain-containing protein [Stackebrandtia nassauensis]ADD42390.1 transcriptional regulator, AraC family [Stackebrandtia nassauensis DSM 44728]
MRAPTLDTERPDPVELHRLCVPDPERVPMAIGSFDSIGPLSRADFPHRHTFYELVLVTAGTGWHVVDFAAHPIRPPHLGFIAPGQVHWWRDAVGLDGQVLLFTDEFLLAHPRDREVWQALGRRPWLNLTGFERREFAALFAQLSAEYRRRDAGFLSVLQSYLHVLLVRACRVADGMALTMATDRPAAVVREFNRLVTHSGWSGYSVRDYATRLGVSVGYLTEVVKQVRGVTPGQLVRRARVLEARRLLGGSDLTIAQVSHALGFSDPAYFCRFFRRETGSTPGSFRRSVD